MSRVLSYIIFFTTIFVNGINSARILSVYPMPSISHQVVFRQLTLALVKRGHDVVTITPNPVYKNQDAPANLKEIDISNAYKILEELYKNGSQIAYAKRGAIFDFSSIINMPTLFIDLLLPMFEHPEVDHLIKGNGHFDLVIIEALFFTPLVFGKIYNAPVIGFTSLYGMSPNYDIVGAVSRHPELYPHPFRSDIRNVDIIGRIKQVINEWNIYKYELESQKLEQEFLKSKFGADTPSIAELKKKMVLLFANVHPIFDGNRPSPPGLVYLGGLHLKPVKPLPQDLQTYLDNSTRGVVYVSLGTNVRPSLMHKEFIDVFLNAFAALPFDFLFKFDGDNLVNIPDNVKVQKFFPQRDLLGHPNVKVFVTQGGLQSTDEAIDATVPLVGIPFLGDQWYNVNKYVELGIGVKLDSFTMMTNDLVKAVNEVANNTKYQENMIKLKTIMQDQRESPIERAVWWTEYVLRHGDSRHLLGAAANVSWSQYLMLDIVLIVSTAALIGVIISALLLYYIISFVIEIKSRVKVKLS